MSKHLRAAVLAATVLLIAGETVLGEAYKERRFIYSIRKICVTPGDGHEADDFVLELWKCHKNGALLGNGPVAHWQPSLTKYERWTSTGKAKFFFSSSGSGWFYVSHWATKGEYYRLRLTTWNRGALTGQYVSRMSKTKKVRNSRDVRMKKIKDSSPSGGQFGAVFPNEPADPELSVSVDRYYYDNVVESSGDQVGIQGTISYSLDDSDGGVVWVGLQLEQLKPSGTGFEYTWPSGQAATVAQTFTVTASSGSLSYDLSAEVWSTTRRMRLIIVYWCEEWTEARTLYYPYPGTSGNGGTPVEYR